MYFALLGRLRLRTGSGAVGLPGPVSRSIVARLLLARGGVVQRDTLIDELWVEREARHPANALQVQITKLRAAFAAQGEEERLEFRHGGYRLVLGPQDELDAVLFETAVREGRRSLTDQAYEQAERYFRDGLSLWRGRALDDLDGPVFHAERVRLEELRLSALEGVASAGLELGRTADLVPELKALLSVEPLRERPRAQLMLALYRCGRHAEALAVYEEGRRMLNAELGVAPSPELRDLHAAVLRHEPSLRGPHQPLPGAAEGDGPTARLSREAHHPAAPAAHQPSGAQAPAPYPSPGPAAPGNLRRPLGPFVGRRADLDALCATVDRERLVTVVGPGGVGKTRLALETCALAQPARDGVWWVDLTSVGDGGVLTAVASALGLSDASVRPDQPPHDYVHRLTSLLEGRRTLLALDNCEHLLDEIAPLVTALLGSCRSLTVLTTSREPLNVSVEALHPLAPMPEEEAADLFSARAVMIEPGFAVDAAAREHVRALCRRLDGLPLAVELAAAHVRLLTVREITARLDNRFALLSRGERTAPARHRTLRAVLDWSYGLLDVSERRVLTELALYVDGCSLKETGRTGLADSASAESELLDVLGRLVDKSLLFSVSSASSAGGNRLRMLDTVREYALARLAEESWGTAAEERFTEWAVRFVHEGTQGVASGDQAGWTRRLTEESANIRAASELLVVRSRVAESLLLEARLGYHWFVSGREDEGIERLQRSLSAYDRAAAPRTDEPTGEEEWALFYTFAWLAWLNHVAGRHAVAGSYIRRHEMAWRKARNPDLAVLGPCYDTLHAMLNGEEGVTELFAVAEAAVVGTRFHWDRAVLQTNWSTYCLQHGDVDGARRHGLVAVAASRAAADDFARAFSLTLCGDADESDGLRERAREQWTEAVRILGPIGARSRWAYAVLRLVCLDIAEGDAAGAVERLAEVDRVADELSADDLVAAVGNLRGVLALHAGRPADAETAFRAVWDSPAAPADRRAVAGLGLASLAATAPAAPVAPVGSRTPQDAHAWLDRVADEHGRLLEPLARSAVGILLDEFDDRRGVRLPAGAASGARRLHERLGNSPSVLAAFC
ncbi:AfsR/SARP family transcriptional regulator [Streptomyces cyaneofuscatus]|uniref:AfsR/SARP family transcriptional regulator n=1 Tax=Streptomyces cyaneofuscatus TaxID=66883 RepID=UPI00341D2E6B